MPRRRRTSTAVYPDDPATRERVAAVAEHLARRYRLADQARRWKPFAADGKALRGDPTVLALDDYSRIPFVKTVVGVAWYQYRARLRCGDGDCYAVSRPAIEGYEAYNRSYLGLGRSHLLRLEHGPADTLELAGRLLHDHDAFERLCGVVRRSGGLLVHPYMAIQPVWELAEGLAKATRVPVHVLGPLPGVTRLANDKACFSEMVERLLGKGSLSHTTASADPIELAERLREYVHRHPAVALKMPSCASGMGNRIFDAAALRRKKRRAVFREAVDRFLEDKEWDGREPVLVVEWHRDVLQSPSTQCWIPPADQGEPEVEEIYQQFLLGDEKVFEGAMLSDLPRALRHELTIQSWLMCRVLQRLGYVGRCSFDALVIGENLRDARVEFVECNGRWGGTSTPMHLMKRVFGDFRLVPYKAQDYVDERLRGLEFTHLMELFGEQLYDRRTGKGRVLLYNVGGVTEHGKFDLVVTGRSFADVTRFIAERIPALITRYLRVRAR